MAPGGPPMLASMWCIKLNGLNYRILLILTQDAEGTRWYSVQLPLSESVSSCGCSSKFKLFELYVSKISCT